ncbi:MAG: serine--tRNA ligase [Alphaproteobacteria bacterium GM7ARS4]|nr:serine--tRNA ligase [Alphaproteobacteria bacterium GM7ARS4]
MLDIEWIRHNPASYDDALMRRDPVLVKTLGAEQILARDKRYRTQLAGQQEAQAQRRRYAEHIGDAKREKKDIDPRMTAKVETLKASLQKHEQETQKARDQLFSLLWQVPNILADDIAIGKNDDDNTLIRERGRMPDMSFAVKDHVTLGQGLGKCLDSAMAATLSGSRFTLLRGGIARLHRALGQFMLDTHITRHGYQEVAPPIIVHRAALEGTGQLPKFAEDLYRLENGQWLIPTAEVPLTNIVRERILDPSALPIRLTALTPCFRSEAGAAGKDTRGMLRQHQFDKVELVSIVHPHDSHQELDRMVTCAESILEALGLAWRVVLLCSASTGFSAHKTYDIEVWLPGQKAYREISSCSLCLDFQARRMQARMREERRDKTSKKTGFVHTLNGSGVAVGRALIAVMENYQQKDGSIIVPEALHPYMGGVTRLTPT